MRIGGEGGISLVVEQKNFRLKSVLKGSKVEIEEIDKLNSSKLALPLGVVACLRDSLATLIVSGLGLNFFRRWRSADALWWVQRISNRRGRCSVLTMDLFKGRRVTLFFPSGRDCAGWMYIKEALDSFLQTPSIVPSCCLQAKLV